MSKLGQINNNTEVDKTLVGLPNVDNTSDVNKPVSSATQTALDGKEDLLGNPDVDGKVLSSTADGTRSWVDAGGGAVDSVNSKTGTVVLTTGDLTEDTDKNYVTDAEKTIIGNTSGTNTGDQDLSGLLPLSGGTMTGTFRPKTIEMEDGSEFMGPNDTVTIDSNGIDVDGLISGNTLSAWSNIEAKSTAGYSDSANMGTDDGAFASKKYVDNNAGGGGGGDTVNFEVLSADKTLVDGDDVIQMLDPNGSNRVITMPAGTEGMRFRITNNDDNRDSSNVLTINDDGGTSFAKLYCGASSSLVFNGTDWLSDDGLSNGAEGYNDSNLAIGRYAMCYGSGVAIGNVSKGYTNGTAVGIDAQGYNYGAALGRGSDGYDYGTAVGKDAKGYNYGVGLGRQSQGYEFGIGIGYNTLGYSNGLGIGTGCRGQNRGIAIGNNVYSSGNTDSYSGAIGWKFKNDKDNYIAFSKGTSSSDTTSKRVGIEFDDTTDDEKVAIEISDSVSAPDTTTNKLYSIGGALNWNGTDLTAGGGGNTSPIFRGLIAGTQNTGELDTYVANGETASKFKASLGTLPTGSDFIIKLYKNGAEEGSVTIATDTTATNGRYTVTDSALTSGSYAEDDVLTVEITQIGSSVAGADLTYSLI